MGKPSAQVLLMQAQKRIKQLEFDLYCAKGFATQQCEDMAQIALHQEFGFGPAYQKRFKRRFRQVFFEYAELCLDDAKDDAALDYTKACVDRSLQAACGDDMLPFDERYALENFYFRDSRDKWKEAAE